MPAVAADHHAMPELIDDGETGLLFESENPLYAKDGRCVFDFVLPPPRTYMDALQRPSDGYVSKIAARLARVAEDDDLHARLASGALKRVRGGAFSIERRRDLLADLYDAAAAPRAA